MLELEKVGCRGLESRGGIDLVEILGIMKVGIGESLLESLRIVLKESYLKPEDLG